MQEPVKALTIGGSDSGGAAGVQADLKTWTALGVYGMNALTAVTAQNSVSVEAVQFLSEELVIAQIDAVLTDYGAQVIKTGFVGQVNVLEAIAQSVAAYASIPLIVDPVLVNHKGQPMFGPEVAGAYSRALLPQAFIVTPNWRESALLVGIEPAQEPDFQTLEDQVLQLYALGPQHVLITGVPKDGQLIDWWYDGEELRPLAHLQITTDNRHGSGDTLSAALSAYLALGEALPDALSKAQAYTERALSAAADWKMGKGHGPLAHFLTSDHRP